MVKVYFGSSSHRELIAVFDNEEVYDLCRPQLSGLAKKHRMTLIESIDEVKIEDYEEINLAIKSAGLEEAYRAGQKSMYCGCYEISGSATCREWLIEKIEKDEKK